MEHTCRYIQRQIQTVRAVNVGKEKGHKAEIRCTSKINAERREHVQKQTRRERDGSRWTQCVLLLPLQTLLGVHWQW